MTGRTRNAKNWEWASLDTEAAVQLVAARRPTPASWGYFSYADASPAAGGGIGGFNWFRSQAEMWDFLEVHEWQSMGAAGDVGGDALREQVSKIVTRLRAGRLGERAGLKELNTVLRSNTQLTWWGTFADLIAGTSEFPKRVREQFRSRGGNDESDSSPIKGKDSASFKDFLAEYGV